MQPGMVRAVYNWLLSMQSAWYGVYCRFKCTHVYVHCSRGLLYKNLDRALQGPGSLKLTVPYVSEDFFSLALSLGCDAKKCMKIVEIWGPHVYFAPGLRNLNPLLVPLHCMCVCIALFILCMNKINLFFLLGFLSLSV